MPWSSQAPNVIASLVNAEGTGGLQTLPELEDVQVTYGMAKNIQREWVAIMGVHWGTRSRDGEHYTSIGNRQREENFSLLLGVNVQMPGADSWEASERAFEIMAAIEMYLRDNPQRPYARLCTMEIVPQSAWANPFSDGYEAQIVVNINCTVRK